MASPSPADGSVARAPVLVIGSANVDVSVRTATLPRAGETVPGDSCVLSVGGKGANQAAAAALLGAPTEFIARIGTDVFAPMVGAALGERGVSTTGVVALDGESTGIAAIYVEHSGQNCIVVVPGANGRLSAADVDRIAPLVASAAIVVLQCEVPWSANLRAVELARAAGVPVLLNPAPSRGLERASLPAGVHYLVPNETEAAAISGMPVRDAREAAACATSLRDDGIGCVIITLGASGCVVADAGGVYAHPAPRVSVVDTTGAGDAFVGCLAAGLAAGCARDVAVRRALLYGSLATTRRGALVSYASGAEFEQVWAASQRAEAPVGGDAQ